MRMGRSRRAGFTLFEMIIVVAMIVLVTAFAVPVVQTQLAESRISASGDLVRGLMAEARSRAAYEGRPWRLGIIVQSGVYQLAPDDAPDWENVATEPARSDALIRDSLPTDVVFDLTREGILNATGPGQPGGGWETAAVFMPDGSATDDTIIYFGKNGVSPLRAKLRALTGSVSIEVPRPNSGQ